MTAAGTVAPPLAGLPLALPDTAAPAPRVLRDYQIEAADAVFDGWERGVQGPAVVLPTGSGKSSVLAEVVRREVARGGRVLMMAHRNELIEQMADTVVAVDPTGPMPQMIGGVHRGDPDAQVVSATVQSLQKPASLRRIGRRDLLLVDEAHHAVAGTYLTVIEHFAAMGARRAGFTATMARHSPNRHEPPLRSVWNEVVYERDIVWAIQHGFLLAPYGVTVTLPDLDVDSLHVGDGEITDDEAESAMMQQTTLNATVAAVVDRTAGLSTILFGASTKHCAALVDRLTAAGVTAEVIIGGTPVHTRRGIYRRFSHGQTRVLVTVDVLTEGTDLPRCEAVVLARPTKSQPRLVQCVGRALRPHTFEDGRIKERALVVDLVGAGSLGLIVETVLDRAPREGVTDDDVCVCDYPCSGPCSQGCTGRDCGCECACGTGTSTGESITAEACTCVCDEQAVICRCGCGCQAHRINPLEDFDPLTGERLSLGKPRAGDSAWSQRTATIRWARHPRGLVRPVYRQTGHKGVLMLADMRGLAGTVPGREWAFGFLNTATKSMVWIDVDGNWSAPGPTCYLRGFSLADADALAQHYFPGHLRDLTRETPTLAQLSLAKSMHIADAETLDRRDLSDLIALAQADKWLPSFARPADTDDTAA